MLSTRWQSFFRYVRGASLGNGPHKLIHTSRCTSMYYNVDCTVAIRTRLLTTGESFQHSSRLIAPLISSDSSILKRHHWYLGGVRTPRAPPTKPVSFDYSGDQEIGLPEVDMSRARPEYADCDELKSADDPVKRIYSLEFGSGQQFRNYCIEEALKLSQRHEGDYTSPEAKVAILTMKIRNQIKYCLERRKDKRAKACLVERIQARKKILKKLLRGDRDKFEQLLKDFKITYVPPPEYYRRKTYKRKLKQAAWKQGQEIKKENLDKFRQSLEKERQEFYAKKDEILADIEKQLTELNLDGPTLLKEVDEEEAKLERKLNSKRYQFKQKFPAANNKYITMTIKD